jgi:hypothetical protein
VAPWTFIVGCRMEAPKAVVQKPAHTPSPAPYSFGLVVRGRRRRAVFPLEPSVLCDCCGADGDCCITNMGRM